MSQTTHSTNDRQVSLIRVPVEIRPGHADDIPLLEWYGQYQHLRNLFQNAFTEVKAGRQLMFVATMNDFPIARLFVQFRNHNPRIADGYKRAYLHSFRVMDMLQGYGIGSRILNVAEHALVDYNYQVATIAVAQDNPRALKLYKNRNYYIFGKDENRWQYTDHEGNVRTVHEPCWLLEKNLIP